MARPRSQAMFVSRGVSELFSLDIALFLSYGIVLSGEWPESLLLVYSEL